MCDIVQTRLAGFKAAVSGAQRSAPPELSQSLSLTVEWLDGYDGYGSQPLIATDDRVILNL